MAYLTIFALFFVAAVVLRRFYLPLIGVALCVSFLVMHLDFAAATKRALQHNLDARMSAVDSIK